MVSARWFRPNVIGLHGGHPSIGSTGLDPSSRPIDAMHGLCPWRQCTDAMHGSDALVRCNWPRLGLSSGSHMAPRTAEEGPGKAISAATRGAQGEPQCFFYSVVFPKLLFYSNPPLSARFFFTVVLARGGGIVFTVIMPLSKVQPSHRNMRNGGCSHCL